VQPVRSLERSSIHRSLTAAAFLYLSTAAVFAQDRPYHVDHWTTDDGLPQNTIRAIVQTRDGYLWLTTFDGLARFDGVHFTVFDKRNTPAITNNRFTALYEDRDGTLWAGADEGEVVAYRDGVFVAYAMPEATRGGAVTFTRDAHDELMAGTAAGAYYLRGRGPTLAPPEYADARLKLYRGPAGTQWTIDARGVRQSGNGQQAFYALTFDWGEGLNGLGAYEDGQGSLWLTDQSGVYRLRDGRISRYTERDGLPPRTTLRPHSQDLDGGIWFSLGNLFNDGRGVARFKDGRFTIYGSDAGLPVTSYLQVVADREGSVWIASANGLFRLKRKPITVYSTADGLPHNEVYPLLQTRDGGIAVGTTHGLSLIADGAVVRHPLSELKQVVQSLWEDRGGRLWIGTLESLYRYGNGKLEDLTPPAVMGAPVWAIREDGTGAVWVGTSRGLVKLDGDRVAEHHTTHDGLPSDDVKVIHESTAAAGQRVLWIGTSGGLARLVNGRFTSFTAADGLAGNRVRSIYEEADGTLWIGTYDDGLSRFRDGTFFNYRTEQGLYNNGVFHILEDRRGNFWISSNKGLYRVSRRELNEVAEGRRSRITSVAFGKADGMLNSECNGGRQPAGLIGRDGRLWFPTMGGVVVVDPEAAPVNPLPPPVLIESVMLERTAVGFAQGVRVEPGQRDLEIAYTGLSLIKPDQVRFKYKLEGLNDDWIEAGTRRVAYFPYLSPGTYTFRVVAANSDGIWNDAGAALRVVVAAPFYRTTWFLTLVVLGMAATGHLAYRDRIAQMRRRHDEQAAFSRRLIDSQEAERKRIASELHDSLGQSLLVIKNRALLGGMSPDDQDTAKEQFDGISVAASQAIDEARRIAYDLRPYHLDRLGLTQSLEEMIERVATATSIRFTINLPVLDGVFSKEGEAIFYRIVQESVSNIVKHSGTSEAVVAIRREEDGVTLTIRDNGKGFSTAVSGASGGFGLIGLAERVQMLGGTYALDTAPGRGTAITVTAPVR
jgi:signal transduction histidine kinase/ligand-binding sensor domain-containing protein